MMYDYKGLHELKVFYTIPEVCELLNLDMDKLRYQCLLHDILPASCNGTVGLDMRSFQQINNWFLLKDFNKEDPNEPWA